MRVLINWLVVNLLVVATVMVISLDRALASKIWAMASQN